MIHGPSVFAICSVACLGVPTSARAEAWHFGADAGVGISFVRNEESLTPLLHPSPGFNLALLARHDDYAELEGSAGLRAFRFKAASLPEEEQLVTLNYFSLGARYELIDWGGPTLVGGGGLLVPISTSTSDALDKETRDQLDGTQATLALSIAGRYRFDLGTTRNAVSLTLEISPAHVIAGSKAVLESYWLSWAIFFH